jgi:hypothetical protein
MGAFEGDFRRFAPDGTAPGRCPFYRGLGDLRIPAISAGLVEVNGPLERDRKTGRTTQGIVAA